MKTQPSSFESKGSKVMSAGSYERLRFWHHNESAVMLALRGHTVAEVVVIVGDLRDPVAKALSKRLSKSLNVNVDQEAKRIERKGDAHATSVMVLPRQAAEVAFQGSHPGVARALGAAAPPGSVYVVVISSGGAMLLRPPVVSLGPPGACES